MIKKLVYTLSVLTLGASLLTGCATTKNKETEDIQKKEIKFGACAGPYGDMIKYTIAPGLEEKGYTVSIIEFSDYVQPNLALDKGEIDANLFQHQVYFDNFTKEHNLSLVSLTNVPTAGLGFYSNKYKSLEEIEEGSTLTVPNDVTNLRRSLKEAQNAGLLTIDESVDPTTFTEKNIIDNPLNLVITPVEAPQLARSLESAELAAVPGNYAIAAGLDLSTALYTEKLAEEMKNVVAVRASDIDQPFVKDIEEVLQSEGFKKAIENSDYYFSSFQKPEWYITKWGK
ncbi:metal ABC transporter substrate-binding protein [Sporanaerobium hydrogeniformans]|uniref:Metal ABC transporter substrate-binding protein n=1 Tax=Sporanaerobium hydrogeniformans TaxID=3072179 RepID=A0AC61D961_9FIRM|nr:MetQ/NlpA family ABC transporter substrate-binding protein [Sporanaerobium hydrogeniformans]PHV69335.1 metal ABC transporter substrate-binding protein [Sporanaerobium hydrogeniformans]